ncbi:MAG: ABC transporter substrate-binding protein [Gemmatimonadaceae bacterium]|nr:ABC transporter substrate-binding protein [Gemmatimonadaceae bacterium]
MQTMLWITALLLPAATLPGCDRGRDAAGPESAVRIGFLAAGDRASYVDAAGIAVDEINEAGGLLGQTVELVARSGIEEPAASVQAAGEMILDDGVIALVGPNRSSHAVVVAETAQRHGLPMITTSATNPEVTRAGGYVFMAAFTDLFQGGVMARFAREDLGLDRVAVLTMRGEVYTEGISEFFVSGFRGSGGTVAAEVFFDRGETDFTEALGRLAETEPGAVFVSGFVEEIALVTRQARALPLVDAAGEPVRFLGADAWDNPNLLAHPAAELEGSFFSTHFSPDSDEPGARAFVDAYRSRYGIPPTGGDAVSYDAVRLLAQAVERAGRLDPEAIRAQLAATEDYAGATRISGYDDRRHPSKSVVIMTIREGEKLFHRQIDPAPAGDG